MAFRRAYEITPSIVLLQVIFAKKDRNKVFFRNLSESIQINSVKFKGKGNAGTLESMNFQARTFSIKYKNVLYQLTAYQTPGLLKTST
jgi:hypothetical protein